MAAANSNKSELKKYFSTKKNTIALATLQSFSISGELRKCKLKIEKFTYICMTGGMHYTPTSLIFVKMW